MPRRGPALAPARRDDARGKACREQQQRARLRHGRRLWLYSHCAVRDLSHLYVRRTLRLLPSLADSRCSERLVKPMLI